MVQEMTFVMAGVVAALLLIDAWRKQRLSQGALIFVAAMSASWLEFFDDWAAQSVWNSLFIQLPWGEMAFTTPNKPLFVPFAWAWFNVVLFLLTVPLLKRLSHWLPRVHPLLLSLLFVGPLFWAYDIGVERSATISGWWRYINPVGPVWESPQGTFPLVWPALPYVLWGVAFTWLMSLRDSTGLWWHERKVGVSPTGSGLKHELARLGAMVVLFHVSHTLIIVVPHYVYRLAFGTAVSALP
jgi:hypothetical protein